MPYCALEVNFNVMRSINSRFTYLLLLYMSTYSYHMDQVNSHNGCAMMTAPQIGICIIRRCNSGFMFYWWRLFFDTLLGLFNL